MAMLLEHIVSIRARTHCISFIAGARSSLPCSCSIRCAMAQNSMDGIEHAVARIV